MTKQEFTNIFNVKLGYEQSSVAWIDEINGEFVICFEDFGQDINLEVNEIKSTFKKRVFVSTASDIINPKDGTYVQAHIVTIKNLKK